MPSVIDGVEITSASEAEVAFYRYFVSQPRWIRDASWSSSPHRQVRVLAMASLRIVVGTATGRELAEQDLQRAAGLIEAGEDPRALQLVIVDWVQSVHREPLAADRVTFERLLRVGLDIEEVALLLSLDDSAVRSQLTRVRPTYQDPRDRQLRGGWSQPLTEHDDLDDLIAAALRKEQQTETPMRDRISELRRRHANWLREDGRDLPVWWSGGQ
jgi:hypothetical protein